MHDRLAEFVVACEVVARHEAVKEGGIDAVKACLNETGNIRYRFSVETERRVWECIQALRDAVFGVGAFVQSGASIGADIAGEEFTNAYREVFEVPPSYDLGELEPLVAKFVAWKNRIQSKDTQGTIEPVDVAVRQEELLQTLLSKNKEESRTEGTCRRSWKRTIRIFRTRKR